MANTKVQSEQIQDGSITADKIADGAIVATELADNAVTTAKINADAVTGAKIADDAIDSEHYTDGSIDTAHIADSQITVAKMAANSVDSDQFVDGSIDTAHLGDLQVTTAKIANGNISTAKIADNAVTSAKLDTNIDIAGTLDVTGATTLDAGLTVDTTTLVVDATNNRVGIGEANPDAALHITSNTPVISFDESDASQEYRLGSFGGAFALYDSTDSAFRIAVDGSGNVGIGTTSPVSQLHLESTGATTLRIRTSSSSSEPQMIMIDGAGDYFAMQKVDKGMTFKPQGSEAMRIDSSGNLQVGFSSYASLGTVNTGCRLSNNGETNALARGSNGTILAFYSGSGGAGNISVSGNAATYNTSSDYRLKENITPIENGLDRLNRLKPVKFDWKNDGTSSEGFIAHEVQEIFSDAISGEKDGEDMQGMDYGRITPLLVKAIQEQQTIIQDLKARIEALES